MSLQAEGDDDANRSRKQTDAGYRVPYCSGCEGPAATIGKLWMERGSHRPERGTIPCRRCGTRIELGPGTEWVEVD